MKMKLFRNIRAPLLASSTIPFVIGCASTNNENVHIYQPPQSPTDKERVAYPLDPDNSNWIARTCEQGSFAYSPKDREFTLYGVVIKAIECIPPKEERGSGGQETVPSLDFLFTGDSLNIPEALLKEFEGLEKQTENPE